MEISVIIPCKNEGSILPTTLGAIVEESKGGLIDEIIVVDNNSTDDSLEIAKRFNVSTYVCSGNISEVRNYGVSKSTGDILCFIDADVEILAGWSKKLKKFIEDNRVGIESIVFGETYGIPNKCTWVERVWFKGLIGRTKANYINGGNLILHRSIFSKLNGFDTGLTTGEDCDLCTRAKYLGCEIVRYEGLETMHHGYPKNIFDFYKRERWLGQGMSKTLLRPHKSKSLILSIAILLLPLIIFLLFNVLGLKLTITAMILACTLMYVLCMKRLNSSTFTEPALLQVLFMAYGLARCHALIDMFQKKKYSK